MLKTSTIGIGLLMLISGADAALVVTEVLERGPYDPPTQVNEHRKFYHLGVTPEDAVTRMKKEANDDSKFGGFRSAAVLEGAFIGQVLGGCVNPGWFAHVRLGWNHDKARLTSANPSTVEFISCGFSSRIAALSAVRDVALRSVGYKLQRVQSEYDNGRSPDYANGSDYNKERKPFVCNVFSDPRPHLRHGYEGSSNEENHYVASWSTDIAAITACEEKSLKPELNITARGFDAIFGTAQAPQRDSSASSTSASRRSSGPETYPKYGPSGPQK